MSSSAQGTTDNKGALAPEGWKRWIVHGLLNGANMNTRDSFYFTRTLYSTVLQSCVHSSDQCLGDSIFCHRLGMAFMASMTFMSGNSGGADVNFEFVQPAGEVRLVVIFELQGAPEYRWNSRPPYHNYHLSRVPPVRSTW